MADMVMAPPKPIRAITIDMIAAIQARLWEGLGGTYRHALDPREAVAGFHGWVVDGLFGLGTRLPLEGAAAAWVQALSDAAGPAAPFRILALDLPSGLDPSSPEAPASVPADRTSCFGHLKVCHGLVRHLGKEVL